MVRIARIGFAPLSLPMAGALRWGAGSELRALEHLLVGVELEGGALGVAEAPVRPTIYGETREGMEAALRSQLAPRLAGIEADDDASVQRIFAALPFNHALKGALDLALAEARAASLGASLAQRSAGPQRRPRVSFILGIAGLDAMLTEAHAVVAAGVRVLKVKVGRDAKHDERVLRALHDALGDGVLLYADANETLDETDAPRVLERLAALGVAYVEEPLPVHRLAARRRLRAAGILPLIADDSAFTPAALERELEADTFDILNIKPARSGWHDTRRMLAMARAAGKGVMIGSQASSGLGTLHSAVAASLEGVTHPSELSFPLKLERDSLDRALPLVDGVLDLDALVGARLRPELWTPTWL
jgi:L-alanine-DL-glutamate epimerase-like enolase superfamily enzyme